MTSALVLAGGGVTGIAWETGLLLGLREAGVEMALDLVIGTSAGAAVGAQLLSGTDLEELYASQVADDHREITPDLDLEQLIALFSEVGDFSAGLTRDLRVVVGTFAKTGSTVSVQARRDVIAWRLPSHTWPTTPLRVTTVDTDTGELVVLDASSGVDLIDAVAASCAVPGVWPPVPLLDRLLMDGGVRSMANLDLAAGADDVLVLVPLAGAGLERVQQQAQGLRDKGATVTVVVADEEATAAMSGNPLDPAMRRPAAEAGRRQGRQGL